MHNLDITDGTVSFADSRNDAWHQLGQQVGHTMTAREAMEEAHLAGWNVRKMPMVIPQPAIITESGVTVPPPIPATGKYATVRTNPVTGGVDFLGVVGEIYTPFQNETSCELLDALVGESGAHFETAGALRGGRDTFVTMKLPEGMQLTGHDGAIDRTDFYLAALNSHDGSSKFRFLITPVRIVCANTQATAITSALASFAMLHTDGADRLIDRARAALGATTTYMQEFEADCRAMQEKPFDLVEVAALAADLFAVEEATTARQESNRHKHVGAIAKLFMASPTVQPFAGTRLGAYNAITEYVDHVWEPRGKRATAQDLRALRTLTSANARDLKAEAFRVLTTA